MNSFINEVIEKDNKNFGDLLRKKLLCDKNTE